MSEETRTASATSRIFKQCGPLSVVAIAALLMFAAWVGIIRTREPGTAEESLEWKLLMIAVALFAAILIIAIWRWCLKSLWAVVPIALFFSVSNAGLLNASDFHWRSSKAEFNRIADGKQISCDPPKGCQVGWWDIERIEQLGATRVLWTRDFGCYIGLGYVRVPATMADPAAIILTELIAAGGSTSSTYVVHIRPALA